MSSHRGCIGSGLAILSRFPIESSFIAPFALNGHPLHFIEGDFFAGKSVCGITFSVPVAGGKEEKVDVLNCHMYAPGGEGEGVEGAHRVAQAWEVAKVVREKVERGRHVLLVSSCALPWMSLAEMSLGARRRPAISTLNPTRSSSASFSNTPFSPTASPPPRQHLHPLHLPRTARSLRIK